MFRGGRSSFGSATLVTCGRLEGFRSLRTSLRRTALSETAIETEATEAARDESVAQGGDLAGDDVAQRRHLLAGVQAQPRVSPSTEEAPAKPRVFRSRRL